MKHCSHNLAKAEDIFNAFLDWINSFVSKHVIDEKVENLSELLDGEILYSILLYLFPFDFKEIKHDSKLDTINKIRHAIRNHFSYLYCEGDLQLHFLTKEAMTKFRKEYITTIKKIDDFLPFLELIWMYSMESNETLNYLNGNNSNSNLLKQIYGLSIDFYFRNSANVATFQFTKQQQQQQQTVSNNNNSNNGMNRGNRMIPNPINTNSAAMSPPLNCYSYMAAAAAAVAAPMLPGQQAAMAAPSMTGMNGMMQRNVFFNQNGIQSPNITYFQQQQQQQQHNNGLNNELQHNFHILKRSYADMADKFHTAMMLQNNNNNGNNNHSNSSNGSNGSNGNNHNHNHNGNHNGNHLSPTTTMNTVHSHSHSHCHSKFPENSRENLNHSNTIHSSQMSHHVNNHHGSTRLSPMDDNNNNGYNMQDNKQEDESAEHMHMFNLSLEPSLSHVSHGSSNGSLVRKIEEMIDLEVYDDVMLNDSVNHQTNNNDNSDNSNVSSPQNDNHNSNHNSNNHSNSNKENIGNGNDKNENREREREISTRHLNLMNNSIVNSITQQDYHCIDNNNNTNNDLKNEKNDEIDINHLTSTHNIYNHKNKNEVANSKIIKLNIGGKIFMTTLNTLTTSTTTLQQLYDQKEDNLFNNLLPTLNNNNNNSNRKKHQNSNKMMYLSEKNEYFIDRDSKYFDLILNFLRNEKWFKEEILENLDYNSILNLKEECKFYGLYNLMFNEYDLPIYWKFLFDCGKKYSCQNCESPKFNRNWIDNKRCVCWFIECKMNHINNDNSSKNKNTKAIIVDGSSLITAKREEKMEENCCMHENMIKLGIVEKTNIFDENTNKYTYHWGNNASFICIKSQCIIKVEVNFGTNTVDFIEIQANEDAIAEKHNNSNNNNNNNNNNKIDDKDDKDEDEPIHHSNVNNNNNKHKQEKNRHICRANLNNVVNGDIYQMAFAVEIDNSINNMDDDNNNSLNSTFQNIVTLCSPTQS